MTELSVVVPIYNVEPYLAACLDSLASQTWRDIEVVMVDDGSPDGSAAIAERFAARDRRFRLVRQPNAGLGAARNTGVLHARGEYLAFVDSDDLVPEYALEYLLASLRATGSDFATGNVDVLTSRGRKRSPMHRPIFRGSAAGTHVTRRPVLLYDRLVTNKVWRRSFWDRHGLRFPEGVLYEDIQVAIPAHFLAGKVDVLAAPVYVWRRHASSITRNRVNIRSMEDRFAAVESVRRFLAEHGSRRHLREWDRVALDSDLRIFMHLLDRADEPFQERFLDLAGGYLARVHRASTDRLTAVRRLQWHLAGNRMLPELLETLGFERTTQDDHARAVRHGLRHYGRLPFLDDPRYAVPREVYRMREDLVLAQEVRSVTWSAGNLQLSGRARVLHLRAARRRDQQMVAWLVRKGTLRRLPLGIVLGSRGRYRFTVDPRRLRPRRASGPATWTVELWVHNHGVFHRAELGPPSNVKARGLVSRQVEEGVWARPHWSDQKTLRITVGPSQARLSGHRLAGDDLELSLAVPVRLGGGARLRLTPRPGGVAHHHPLVPGERPGTFGVRVPAGPLRRSVTGRPSEWRAHVVGDAISEPIAVTMAGPKARARYTTKDREITLYRTAADELAIRVRNPRTMATLFPAEHRPIV
ncbi:glycosyltransferase [Sphaerisporangium corydalis]|uniref:Glycosyltransferase n=1 Tax=Sphaerisporangium corydalis TaxID=1441875 RepID=A0ABV9EN08_9ACTN|nr:glycosyltransferase [Sphaerisporangium corydalis]